MTYDTQFCKNFLKELFKFTFLKFAIGLNIGGRGGELSAILIKAKNYGNRSKKENKRYITIQANKLYTTAFRYFTIYSLKSHCNVKLKVSPAPFLSCRYKCKKLRVELYSYLELYAINGNIIIFKHFLKTSLSLF